MARRWERRQAVNPLPCKQNGKDVGLITMLGVKGATILGKAPMDIGSEFTLSIALPASLKLGDTFEIQVEVRWSRKNTQAGGYDTGVKFEASSADQMNVLGVMLDALTTL